MLGRERRKGWKVAQMAQVASSRVSKINILNKEIQFSALTNFKSLIQIQMMLKMVQVRIATGVTRVV